MANSLKIFRTVVSTMSTSGFVFFQGSSPMDGP